MKKVYWIMISVVLVLLSACSMSTTPKQDKLKVVTTFYPVYYLTKQVVKDNAEVSILINNNIEPHDYEPSAKDVANVSDANIFVYSNRYMETWVEKLKTSLNSSVKFVESGSQTNFIAGQEHEHHEEEHEEDYHEVDPHIWLDPSLAKQQVKVIVDALKEVDKANAKTYEKNGNELIEKLDKVEQSYKEAFSNATNKVFAVQHAAFGYIANNYQLEQLAISTLFETEPSAKEIANVVEEMKEHHINTIYVDKNSSQNAANTVAKEIGATVSYLYTLETEVDGMDYLQVLIYNLDALKQSIK